MVSDLIKSRLYQQTGCDKYTKCEVRIVCTPKDPHATVKPIHLWELEQEYDFTTEVDMAECGSLQGECLGNYRKRVYLSFSV